MNRNECNLHWYSRRIIDFTFSVVSNPQFYCNDSNCSLYWLCVIISTVQVLNLFIIQTTVCNHKYVALSSILFLTLIVISTSAIHFIFHIYAYIEFLISMWLYSSCFKWYLLSDISIAQVIFEMLVMSTVFNFDVFLILLYFEFLSKYL